MFLKSEGFASNLHDPQKRFTLARFCAESGLRYNPLGCPVPLETFTSYGLEFQRQLVPDVEERIVVALHRSPGGFLLELDDGDAVAARRVIIAVGITHFAHLPASLAHLPPDVVSHSSDHRDLARFKNRDVTVIGGGASALDIAASLYDAGADVRLVARRSLLIFNSPVAQPWWKRWCPTSQLGGGWRNQFYEHGPLLFQRLPQGLRRSIVRSALGPAGGASTKDRVERVPTLLQQSLRYAHFRDGRVHLRLLCGDGEERTLRTDHVIAGTGYRVDLRRLMFLGKELRPQLRAVDFTPILSANFESSVRGLYFVGLASAITFGPSMRFLVGARYTARRLVRHFTS
jgi:hypothetical protein